MANKPKPVSCQNHPGEDCHPKDCLIAADVRMLKDRGVALSRIIEECRESVLAGADDPLGMPLSAALEAAHEIALSISGTVGALYGHTILARPSRAAA